VVKLLLIGLLGAALAFPQDSFVPIHAIQGREDTSPLNNLEVTTRGIVTARRANGFYIQAPEAEYDFDWSTSEGIFVFTSTAPPAAIQRGALVRVTGTVTEFRPAADLDGPTLTELVRPSDITVVSTGHTLPAPLELARTHTSAGWGFMNLERFEGMRVSFPRLLVVSPTEGTANAAAATATSNGIFYAVLPGTPRPWRGGGEWDGSPERVRVDTNAQSSAARVDAATGMLVEELAGPLDFGNRTWTLVADPGVRIAGAPRRALPLPVPAAGEFTIATLNLQRFFDESDDPSTSDVVITPAAFAGRVAKFARQAHEILHLPDILGVQECENLATLTALAERLNREAIDAGQGDPGYRAFLEEGTDPGGIDSGFLVKTSRVTVRSITQTDRTVQYTRPDGRLETLNERPPLALRAQVDRSFPVTVVVNHFRSLTDIDDPVAGPRIRLKRRLQAEQLRDLVLRLERETPEEAIAAIGDFNTLPFSGDREDPLVVLEGGTPLRMLDTELPADQGFSYLFGGTAQSLDHILVNPALAARWSRIAVGRVNATFPEALRGDFSRSERLSDHEPMMAYFRLDEPLFTAARVVDAVTGFTGAVAAGQVIEIRARGLSAAEVVTVNGRPMSVQPAAAGGLRLELPFFLGASAVVQARGTLVRLPVVAAVPSIEGSVVPAGDVVLLDAAGLGEPVGEPSQATVTVGGIAADVLWANPWWEVRATLLAMGVQIPYGLPQDKPQALVVTVGEYSSPRAGGARPR
jgi:predicted extracellular nuclease